MTESNNKPTADATTGVPRRLWYFVVVAVLIGVAIVLAATAQLGQQIASLVFVGLALTLGLVAALRQDRAGVPGRGMRSRTIAYLAILLVVALGGAVLVFLLGSENEFEWLRWTVAVVAAALIVGGAWVFEQRPLHASEPSS